ncbi:MAG: hypothetical protein ISR87_01940 [Candidatus Marinimicrobia bacterium]|nr:hypothetical protein [FCB group bacterium]MBL7024190.1 hypothetical protein [Candidatus Neomarinimicrobiota bacterium]
MQLTILLMIISCASIFGQDTLITTSGMIYTGNLNEINDERVIFTETGKSQPQSIPLYIIGQIVSETGTVDINEITEQTTPVSKPEVFNDGSNHTQQPTISGFSLSPFTLVHVTTADQIMKRTHRKRVIISFTNGTTVKSKILRMDSSVLVWRNLEIQSRDDSTVTPLSEILRIKVGRSRLGGGVRFMMYGGILGGTVGFALGYAGGPGPGIGEGSYNETAFDSGLLGAGFIGYLGAVFLTPIGILIPGHSIYHHEGMAKLILVEQLIHEDAKEIKMGDD